MAHNRTTQYSAPYRRNNLMSLSQYAASAEFPTLGSWDRARTDDLYVVRGTAGRSRPVCITVVGAISSDKTHLEPHGNYDPRYMVQEQIGKKAKLQFVISAPADDPDFASDYQVAVTRLRAIQDDVAASPTRRDHFLDMTNMKMNFLLFEPKTSDEIDVKKEDEEEVEEEEEVDDSGMEMSDEEEGEVGRATPKRKASAVYQVNQEYREAWAEAGKTYHNNVMEVYGPDEVLIGYKDFNRHLVSGTTVAVSFVLKHYAIRERGVSTAASDTYSAIVRSVSILKAAEKIVRVSPGSTPRRRPLPVSQSPSKATLKHAADTFSPIRQAKKVVNERPRDGRSASSQPQPVQPEGSQVQRDITSDKDSNPSLSLVASLLPLLLEHLKNPASPFYNMHQPKPDVTSSSAHSFLPVETLNVSTSKEMTPAGSPSVSTESTLSTGSETGEPLVEPDAAWVQISDSDLALVDVGDAEEPSTHITTVATRRGLGTRSTAAPSLGGVDSAVTESTLAPPAATERRESKKRKA